MGYTHYWKFNKPTHKIGESQRVETLYQKAIKDCYKAIRRYQREYPKGNKCRLSGYSAHTSKYGGIGFNGKGGLAHEDFTMREHYSQNLEHPFNFCKTALKPYDTVVVACLAILKHRLGDLIEVSSDGSALDWRAGVELARAATRLAVKNPIKPDGTLKVV